MGVACRILVFGISVGGVATNQGNQISPLLTIGRWRNESGCGLTCKMARVEGVRNCKEIQYLCIDGYTELPVKS